MPTTRVENLGPMRCKQRLVRGDDIFARGQQIENGLFGPFDAADDFDGAMNRRIAQNRLDVGRDQVCGNINRPRLVGIANHDAFENDRPPRASRQAFGLFEEQFRHAAANRAAANQGDAVRIHANVPYEVFSKQTFFYVPNDAKARRRRKCRFAD